MTDSGLAGLTALVSGGASGIGEAIAVALTTEGVQTAVVDRNPCEVGSVQLQETLGDPTSAERVVRAALAELGQIDLFVNCAAIARHEPVHKLSSDAVEATMASNFLSCVWLSRSIAQHMIERQHGSILIVGSTSIYTPAQTESIYRASKAALKAFAEVLALELAPWRIRVNILTPGAVATPLTAGMSSSQRQHLEAQIPLGREASTAELTATALLLLSDQLSSYTTGTEFIIDGGLRLRPLSIDRD